MREAVAYVSANPGCAILPIAEHIGPHGSRKYGYAAVHRAAKAGLIVLSKGKGNAYSCTLPEHGPWLMQD